MNNFNSFNNILGIIMLIVGIGYSIYFYTITGQNFYLYLIPVAIIAAIIGYYTFGYVI
jgi:hypothetical protein